MIVKELLNFQQIVGLVLLIFGYILFSQWRRCKQLPPGPWGIPIVGYLPFLGIEFHKKFIQLGQKYGSVFSIGAGNVDMVVLNDWDAVRAALIEQSENFAVRPPIFLLDTAVNHTDVTTSNGPLWKKRRHFFIQNLKPFSMQKSVRESVVMEAVQQLMDMVEKMDGQVHNLHDPIFFTIMNVTWRMASSCTVSQTDEKSKQLIKFVKMNFEALATYAPLNFLPWLRYVVPGGCGYLKLKDCTTLLKDYLRSEVEQHLENFQEGSCNDYIDAFLTEMKKHEKANGTEESLFTMDFLIGSLWDIFLAGIETTSTTLQWGFLYLAINYKIQEKVQEELDQVVGRGRLPCFEDQGNLPYLEAVTMEIHRLSSVVQLSVLHTCYKSTTVLGKPIPRGATVIEHIYGVHRDPKVWAKPDEFWPERFFDANNKLRKPEYLIPFSTGPRRCPGEQIAKVQLFLVFSCLLHKFSFRIPPNTPTPSVEGDVTFTLSPKPYSLLIQSR